MAPHPDASARGRANLARMRQAIPRTNDEKKQLVKGWIEVQGRETFRDYSKRVGIKQATLRKYVRKYTRSQDAIANAIAIVDALEVRVGALLADARAALRARLGDVTPVGSPTRYQTRAQRPRGHGGIPPKSAPPLAPAPPAGDPAPPTTRRGRLAFLP